jgi:nucleoside-diphosphate-sugar epimerase
MLVNSHGTEKMLKLAMESNSRFLLASTSEVYGDPLEHPQKESYSGNVNTLGPRACYDESKRYAETLTKVFEKEYSISTRIVRIFNTYGPKMRKNDGRVVSNFINQAINNQPLTVYGEGEQTRSFCYISDMVRGLNKLMFTPDIDGEVVNIGNPHEVTILELAKTIKELADSNSEIVYKELPKDDPQRRCPEIAKAKSILAWQPQINLKQGLKQTIQYFKDLK